MFGLPLKGNDVDVVCRCFFSLGSLVLWHYSTAVKLATRAVVRCSWGALVALSSTFGVEGPRVRAQARL
jgi:hypothetical protein